MTPPGTFGQRRSLWHCLMLPIRATALLFNITIIRKSVPRLQAQNNEQTPTDGYCENPFALFELPRSARLVSLPGFAASAGKTCARPRKLPWEISFRRRSTPGFGCPLIRAAAPSCENGLFLKNIPPNDASFLSSTILILIPTHAGGQPRPFIALTASEIPKRAG